LGVLLKELERTKIRRVHNENQHVNESPSDYNFPGKKLSDPVSPIPSLVT
jgi:hypothetical protein